MLADCSPTLLRLPTCPLERLRTGSCDSFVSCTSFRAVAIASSVSAGVRFRSIVENVIMNRREDVDFFSKQLQVAPSMLCASDFGVINRPRLFWTRIDFARIKVNPITD